MNTFSTWVESVGGPVQVAEILGCTPDAVRKWVRGERVPRPQMAAEIERASGGKVSRASLLWPPDQAA
jgi:DNA-binding transcriptional regulator YdaS (Cro superfamily)